MCPSYLATRDEKDSTRGRARVLQELANGSLVTGGWRSPAVHEALDLCLSCKACSRDCPVSVDMATYKSEVLYQAYRGRLRPRSHYALGWLPRWVQLAGLAPGLANAALRLPPVAGLVRLAAGIDPRRPLPEFARRPGEGRGPREGQRPGPRRGRAKASARVRAGARKHLHPVPARRSCSGPTPSPARSRRRWPGRPPRCWPRPGSR